MPQDHRIQLQRFELKYLITEDLASAVKRFVSSCLELDEFAMRQPGGAYPIHSLYLDSAGLATHQASLNGNRNRFKLRLRYYEHTPDSPVYCEIKGRADHCVHKSRCGVRREALPLILAGQLPEASSVISPEPRDWFALLDFHERLIRLRARPQAHNYYLREAWVSAHDNSVRVNFDRDVCLEPCFDTKLRETMRNPARPYGGLVVLELKFANRFPNWFRELVEHFNLVQTSVGKYSDGVAAIGETRFRAMGAESRAMDRDGGEWSAVTAHAKPLDDFRTAKEHV